MKHRENEGETKEIVQENKGGQNVTNSLRTVCSNSQVLYTNIGWSVCMFRVGLHRVHGWAPFLFGAPLVRGSPSVGAVGAQPQLF